MIGGAAGFQERVMLVVQSITPGLSQMSLPLAVTLHPPPPARSKSAPDHAVANNIVVIASEFMPVDTNL
jgi:hypothetical protein